MRVFSNRLVGADGSPEQRVARRSTTRLYWLLAWYCVNLLMVVSGLFLIARLVWPVHPHVAWLLGIGIWVCIGCFAGTLPIPSDVSELRFARGLFFLLNSVVFSAGMIMVDLESQVSFHSSLDAVHVAGSLIGGMIFALGMMGVSRHSFFAS